MFGELEPPPSAASAFNERFAALQLSGFSKADVVAANSMGMGIEAPLHLPWYGVCAVWMWVCLWVWVSVSVCGHTCTAPLLSLDVYLLLLICLCVD